MVFTLADVQAEGNVAVAGVDQVQAPPSRIFRPWHGTELPHPRCGELFLARGTPVLKPLQTVTAGGRMACGRPRQRHPRGTLARRTRCGPFHDEADTYIHSVLLPPTGSREVFSPKQHEGFNRRVRHMPRR